MGKFVANDWGKLVLRVTIGGLLLFHGISKIVGGVGTIPDMLEAKGLPGVLAYAVYLGEVAAPLLLLAGFYARVAAVVVCFNMCVAILLAHLDQLTEFGAHGEWSVETPMLYLLGSLAIALLGPGHIALKKP